MPDGLFIDDRQMNGVVQHLLEDPEEDVRNIINTIH